MRKLAKWRKGFAEWQEGNTAFLSVVFTWDADKALSRAMFLRAAGFRVLIGGPGVFHNKLRSLFDGVAEWQPNHPKALHHHNPDACFAVRGCNVGCWFCIVPKMEGRNFTVDEHFVPKPILCDNNLSGTDPAVQDFIIARYREKGVLLRDAQSGFEPASFTGAVYERWRGILREGQSPWRFACDEWKEAEQFVEMARILRDEPRRRKRVYVLIGNEPFRECLARLQLVMDSDCDPHVQPFIKLVARTKTYDVRHDWNPQLLRDVARWANRFVWRRYSFAEYNRSIRQPREAMDDRQACLV